MDDAESASSREVADSLISNYPEQEGATGEDKHSLFLASPVAEGEL
jgi:hypothetical protein